jgi:hypothetical protein
MPMSATAGTRATITCRCGRCALGLADGMPTMHILCGCEDCRQALQWGHAKGGARPDPLPSLHYMKSDIIDIKGRDYMIAVKLREDGRSRRVYCRECHSVLGVDHPVYKDRVFMNYPKHCVTAGCLDVPVSLMLFMHDYPSELGPVPEERVPVFQSLRFVQEQDRLRLIEGIANCWFKEREQPPVGMTFTALIASLGETLVLNLPRGERVS